MSRQKASPELEQTLVEAALFYYAHVMPDLARLQPTRVAQPGSDTVWSNEALCMMGM